MFKEEKAYRKRYSQEAIVLLKLAQYIEKYGLREDLDKTVTDYNLGKHLTNANKLPSHMIEKMREMTEGLDEGIDKGLVAPRLELLKRKIQQVNTVKPKRSQI